MDPSDESQLIGNILDDHQGSYPNFPPHKQQQQQQQKEAGDPGNDDGRHHPHHHHHHLQQQQHQHQNSIAEPPAPDSSQQSSPSSVDSSTPNNDFEPGFSPESSIFPYARAASPEDSGAPPAPDFYTAASSFSKLSLQPPLPERSGGNSNVNGETAVSGSGELKPSPTGNYPFELSSLSSLMLRSASAPPQVILGSPVASSDHENGGHAFDFQQQQQQDTSGRDRDQTVENLRSTPEYYYYYYNQRPLDPRLPPPLYDVSSWQNSSDRSVAAFGASPSSSQPQPRRLSIPGSEVVLGGDSRRQTQQNNSGDHPRPGNAAPPSPPPGSGSSAGNSQASSRTQSPSPPGYSRVPAGGASGRLTPRNVSNHHSLPQHPASPSESHYSRERHLHQWEDGQWPPAMSEEERRRRRMLLLGDIGSEDVGGFGPPSSGSSKGVGNGGAGYHAGGPLMGTEHLPVDGSSSNGTSLSGRATPQSGSMTPQNGPLAQHSYPRQQQQQQQLHHHPPHHHPHSHFGGAEGTVPVGPRPRAVAADYIHATHYQHQAAAHHPFQPPPRHQGSHHPHPHHHHHQSQQQQQQMSRPYYPSAPSYQRQHYYRPPAYFRPPPPTPAANLTLMDVVDRGLMVHLATDQHGSRFIQQKLETAHPKIRAAAFEQLRPDTLHLCTDVFGNYVIQKFLEFGTPQQKRILAAHMIGHVLTLSLHMFGCRVIQKAIDVTDATTQGMLVRELDGYVLQCVTDQNGNHVIQKCIERIPPAQTKFIVEAFQKQMYDLSTHPYGCRVIQRLLEYCDMENRRKILEEILLYTSDLCQNQYGNYIIQHVLLHGQSQHRHQVIRHVQGKVLLLSRHKFASNVVEKCFAVANTQQRDLLLAEVLGASTLNVVAASNASSPDSGSEEEIKNLTNSLLQMQFQKLHENGSGLEGAPLVQMVHDQYANYVVQTLLDVVTEQQRHMVIEIIRRTVPNLRKIPYGKHIITRIEKITGKPVI